MSYHPNPNPNPNPNSQPQPFAIAIHGGAGTISKAQLPAPLRQAYKDTLTLAIDSGAAILAQGGDSVSAVQAAITVLEDSPLFNAGIGSVYTYEGGHELDAAIMDGRTMKAGAVAGVRHIANPIHLAYAVMQRCEHVMLLGAGAEEFALSQGFTLVAHDYFATPSRYQQLQDAKTRLNQAKAPWQLAGIEAAKSDDKFGTVGAVALDSQGNLAAGTSTGGMTAKRFGRIGDSALIGAGTYAENGVCAVSATGHGEFFIRYHVAGDICAKVKYQQQSVMQAAEEVVMQRLVANGGAGGVIAIDSLGNIATPFNTEGMYRATRRSGEPAKVLIWDEE
ncbi:MAG: isoaspartyl peptidase/L-asparaginase family protein [Shewanella sp.]